MQRLGFAIGVLILLTGGLVTWMGVRFRFEPKEPLKDFRSPVLALEFVESANGIAHIVGDLGDENREKVRGSLHADFFLIAAYWLLFGSMGFLLARRPEKWAMWLAIAAGICITAAASLDIVENLRTLRVLDLPLAKTTDDMARMIRSAALLKWGLLFVTFALLAPAFFQGWTWQGAIGPLFLIAAGCGLVGLCCYRPAIEWAFVPLSIGLLLAAVRLLLFPGKI
ncbi:MAG: hypothetical protein ACE5HC_13675 [Candidatus Binatia bacterium]